MRNICIVEKLKNKRNNLLVHNTRWCSWPVQSDCVYVSMHNQAVRCGPLPLNTINGYCTKRENNQLWFSVPYCDTITLKQLLQLYTPLGHDVITERCRPYKVTSSSAPHPQHLLQVAGPRLSLLLSDLAMNLGFLWLPPWV